MNIFAYSKCQYIIKSSIHINLMNTRDKQLMAKQWTSHRSIIHVLFIKVSCHFNASIISRFHKVD